MIDIMVNERGPMPKRLNITFTGVLYAIALVVLAWQLGSALMLYGQTAASAVRFPYPLDYGEGPILDQVMRLARFENIYRADLSQPPYTVSNYPPLFLLLQTPFAWIDGPAYWYGRVLSLVSALVAALFLGLTVHRLTGDIAASVISGALLLAFPYLLYWSALNRVDTLALALSWAGLYAVVRWPDRRRGLVLAVILFAAAVFTKQTYALVGPGTALIWLLQGKHYRQAARFAGGLAGVCLAVFLLLNLATGGGFFLNIVTANANRVSHVGFMANATGLFLNAWILVMGAIGFLVVERWWYPTRTWPLVLPYTMMAAATILLAGKAGASVNYLYEPAAALCLAAGAVVAWPGRSYLLKTAAILLLALQVSGLVSWSRGDFLPLIRNKLFDEVEVAQLAQMVREAGGPVLSDEYMGLSPLAGQPIPYQPFEFAQLQSAGLWSPDLLIDAIEQKDFPIIVLYEPSFGPPMIVSRWTPEIRDAIWQNYHSVENLAGAWVYLPNE